MPAQGRRRLKLNDCGLQMLSGMLNVEKQAVFRPGKEKARLLRRYVAASGLKLLPRYRRLLSPDLAVEVASKQTVVPL
jgi:hypothetical protein